MSKVRIWQPIEWGEKVNCNCGEQECWKAIEMLPDSLVVHMDSSDPSAGSATIDLPTDVTLAKVVERDTLIPEDDLTTLIMQALEATGVKPNTKTVGVAMISLVNLHRIYEPMLLEMQVKLNAKDATVGVLAEQNTKLSTEAYTLRGQLQLQQAKNENLMDDLVKLKKEMK